MFMLKEIKNPTLEVTIDSTKSGLVDTLYTSKTVSQFSDDEHERCYKEQSNKKFAGHGCCLGFLDERKETKCSKCWHYISI